MPIVIDTNPPFEPDTATHSPLPWRVGEPVRFGTDPDDKPFGFKVHAATGPFVALFHGSDNPLLTREMALANAQLTVSACNSHAMLVEALRSIANDFFPSTSAEGELEAIRSFARSALASAEGKA
jgi:hypothetical protein